MSDAGKRNAEVVRRYLRGFETREVAELAELVAEDVIVHGAGSHVRGRHYPEGAVLTPGLSNCRVQVDDFFTMTGIKSYRLQDGRIVEFWGETDLYGLLRQIGHVPEEIPPF